jgi:serine/threonine protein kinase
VSPEEWEKLSPLVDQVLDLSAEEQDRFLQQLRADNPELCQQVESQLKRRAPTDRLTVPPPPLEEMSPTPSTAETLRRADDPPPRLPEIAGYQVLGLLGRGGMGRVYKARQIALNRIVVLKMIRLGEQANDAEVQRFRTEAEALAQLQHPNIVQIYEVGHKNGQPYFSAEYVAGGSLDRFLGGKPQPPQLAAEIVEQLACAMQFAHAHGILHRDLKPANVLLAGDGDSGPSVTLSSSACRLLPKITDFGLAKRLEVEDGNTQTGAILGTPNYMAPEQAQGKSRHVRAAADIYALGAILYEMLTGRPPFRGDQMFETLRQVIHDEPVAPTRVVPTVPRDLETICLKCLEKDTTRRYPSALALAEDLRLYLTSRPIKARPLGFGQRSLRWLRRQPVLAVLAGFMMALVVGAVFWLWSKAAPPRDSEAQRPGDTRGEQPGERKPVRPVRQPRPNGRLLFQDRFDTPKPIPEIPQFLGTEQWIGFENVNGRGRYRTAIAGITGVLYAKEQAGDFAVEYEFQTPKPSPGSGYGFFFRAEVEPVQLPTYYVLFVYPNTKNIYLHCWQRHWTLGKAFDIPPGGVNVSDSNAVRLEAVGSEFRIFLNGRFIGEVNDDKVKQSGTFGFWVSKGDAVEDIVYFANLRLYELAAAP